MSPVRLRPGAAVETVDEGLLFSGWQGSTLMVCKPGVAKVWHAVQPAVRSGFEADVLRARLPDAARGVYDVLMATLRDNGMLIAAPARQPDEYAAQQPDEYAARRYLAYSAADPVLAGEVLAGTTVGVRGAAQMVPAVVATLAECGVRVADAGRRSDWVIYLGDLAGFRDIAVEADLVAAAVAVGPTVVVAPCDRGPDRLLAAVDRLPGGDAPTSMTWAIARTVLIECVHRLIAGTSRADRCFLVDAAGSSDVPLAPPRHVPEPSVLPAAAGSGRDDVALLARLEPVTADRIGPFPAPAPGTLVQHPLARQAAGAAQGAGLDQARAGADAVLCALREQLAGLGGCPVAGDGPADLAADAVGRLAVACAPEPETPWEPDTPVAHRWVQAAARLAGQRPDLRASVHRGVAVTRAAVAGRESWGYGADPATAGEHATRGLLKALVADLPTPARAIVVSHEATTAAPLLRAVLGLGPDRDLPRLPEALPGIEIRPYDLGGGLADAGVLLGIAEVRP